MDDVPSLEGYVYFKKFPPYPAVGWTDYFNSYAKKRGLFLCWMLDVVVTLEDAWISHAFNHVLILTFPFFRDFLLACHQVLVLRSLWVLHFLLGSIPRVQLRLESPPVLLQTLGITVYGIVSHLAPWLYANMDLSLLTTGFITCLGLIFYPIKFDHLCDRFLYKFILLRNIHVDYTSISFCYLLIFNSFCCTFVHFTIVVFTWYDFTSYYILLPMSISARVFWPWSIFLGVLFMSLLKFHIKVWYNLYSWLLSTGLIVGKWFVMM